MNKIIALGGIIITAILFTGCSHKHHGVTYPNHDINDIGKVFVECRTYDREQFPLVCGDITDEISLLGYDVSKGKKEEIPEDTKAIVSYTDGWYWDMSMYMLSLEMIVREKATNDYIAESFVERTSLIRKNTKEMAREALSEIVFQSVVEREKYLKEKININSAVDFNSIKKIYIMSIDNKSTDQKLQKYILELGYEVELGNKKYYTDDIDAVLVLNKNYGTRYWQLRDQRTGRLLAQAVKNTHKKEIASDLKILTQMFDKINKK